MERTLQEIAADIARIMGEMSDLCVELGNHINSTDPADDRLTSKGANEISLVYGMMSRACDMWDSHGDDFCTSAGVDERDLPTVLADIIRNFQDAYNHPFKKLKITVGNREMAILSECGYAWFKDDFVNDDCKFMGHSVEFLSSFDTLLRVETCE